MMTLMLLAALAQDPPREKTTKFTLEQGRLVLPGPILFEAGTAAIQKEAEPSLWVVVDFLEAKDYITKLRIEGHVDLPGEKGQTLSEQRALAVAKWLVAKGVDPKRVLPVGFGAYRPVEDNATPAGKAANRRIEFRPAELRGKAMGGLPLDGGGNPAGDPSK